MVAESSVRLSVAARAVSLAPSRRVSTTRDFGRGRLEAPLASPSILAEQGKLCGLLPW